MFKRARWNLVIPIMIVVFFGAMFVVNQFYPSFPQEDRLTMYIWAAMISGVISFIMFPSKEQEKMIEEGHAEEKAKLQAKRSKKTTDDDEQKPKFPYKP
ncbi:MAG: hypothetical protein KIG60_04015 [Caryophanon sp.]|nr:hypothetical protein [Caryophanon sp.]